MRKFEQSITLHWSRGQPVLTTDHEVMSSISGTSIILNVD